MSATSSARPRDDAGVVENFLDRDWECAVGALHHHPEAVADQQRVDAGVVEDARERRVVGGQHGDWSARGFHRGEIGNANFLRLIHRCSIKNCAQKKSGPPRTDDPEHRSTLLPISTWTAMGERSSLRVPVL